MYSLTARHRLWTALRRQPPSLRKFQHSRTLAGVTACRGQDEAISSVTGGSYNTRSPFVLAIGAMLVGASSVSILSCQQAEEKPLTHSSETNEEEEDDPYANLPEEDEDTECSMCKTFRQGPCRPFWRKLERCFKDHEDEEDGASKCIRYFSPHQKCLMNYTNLYQLVSLDIKQELVSDAEMSIRDDERKKWDVGGDWSKYKEFLKEAGSSFSQLREDFTPESPLWKRIKDDTEPVLVATTSHLPKVDGESGLILKIAYALDQDGMVLGLAFNQGYGKLVDKAKGKEPEEGEDDKKEDESPDLELEFYIIPSNTKQVCIKGLYAEDPTKVDDKKEILDALLFESQMYDLEKLD